MRYLKLARRVAQRHLERQGFAPYPVMNLHDEDTPDLDSWREKAVVPDDDHSEIPGDEDEEDEKLDGQTGKWTR